ncbi:hypothetical protein AAVH_01201 [Aphelenchoides avenae]|nr:hypothetical protein AAVH_01201 [Aphelenchus avenae]
MERSRFFSSPHRLTRDNLVGTLYDQRTQFLYLIFERTVDGAMRAEVFLMERIYSVTTSTGWQNTHKFSLDLHDSFFGSMWTSDSGRAYYTLEETMDRQKVVDLRWIDFNQLVPSLKNGRHGTVVATVEGSSVPVELAPFDGLVYKKEHAPDGTTHQLIDTLDSERELECSSSAAPGPAFTFVITGWEYCKVRDGATANKSRCEEEATEEVSSSTGIPAKQPQSQGSSIGMGISLVIICSIVGNAVLCMCIGYCVMRSRESKYAVSDRPPPMYTTMECTRRLQDSEMSF